MYNTQTNVVCGHYALSSAHNISHMNDKTKRNVGAWGILNQPRNLYHGNFKTIHGSYILEVTNKL